MPTKAKGKQGPSDVLEAADAATQQAYEALRVKLVNAKTQADLYAAVDSDFKAEVARLPEEIQRILRDTFAIMLDDLKGKVKMDELRDKPVTIKQPPDFPTPTIRDERTQELKPFVVIKGVVDESGEKFECVSSAVRIVRHFENSKLDSYPQHITFYQEDAEQMAARGAKQGTNPMWLVRRNAQPAEKRGAVPF